MERYSIWEGFMNDLEKKVAKIQRKCSKFGCDFHFAKVGEEIREVEDFTRKDPETGKAPMKIKCKFIVVEAEGTAVINNWKFVASVEHTENGNIFSKAMTDVEKIAEEEFLPEEVADELYECMVELEGDEDV